MENLSSIVLEKWKKEEEDRYALPIDTSSPGLYKVLSTTSTSEVTDKHVQKLN